jgi:hypothetical protein
LDDLIKGLQIIRSHMKNDVYNPSNCMHDEISLSGIYGTFNINDFSDDEINELEELGWDYRDDE